MQKPGSTLVLVAQAILIVATPFCLALGLVLPLMRFERLYFFDEQSSLLEIVAALWRGGDVLLAAVIGLVSVILPALKILFLAAEALAVRNPGQQFISRRIVPVLSKWSMMDVLIVALVIVAAKTSGFASAFTQPGLWFYAVSSINSGLLHALSEREESRKLNK